MAIHPRAKRSIVIAYDMLSVLIAWLMSYWFRFNLDPIPEYWLAPAIQFLPFVLITQCACFYAFKLYRGIWRFVSVLDVIRILKATITSTTIIATIAFYTSTTFHVPRSVPLLYAIFLMATLCGGRFIVRWLKDYRKIIFHGKRTLIVGAGAAGEQLARDLLRHTSKEYQPVAFIDDNLALRGKEVHGIPVFGPCANIKEIVHDQGIELILIALPSADSMQMRTIVEYCENINIPFRTLPSLRAITDGNVSISALREVSLEDLLGRDPVDLDWDLISKGVKDKRIIVTGGGGSIGSELCRQIARLKPQCLTVIEQNEFNLYKLEMELNQQFPELQFNYYLTSVTSESEINQIVTDNKTDIIFHAAAYKHVPLLESQLTTAIKNNVLGTDIMCRAAVKHQVNKFVLISTDKAVNPTNIMGATKRVAELVCQSYQGKASTQFITVRFGNVLGSVGSVIPLFRKQLETGGPITVTHPDITRYFMTIPEATQLILKASAVGEDGQICILDMGEPIKITYLAEQMIRLAGLQPDKDIKIEFTGLRPGEKLYEELFYEDELHSRTPRRKLFVVNHHQNKLDIHLLLNELFEACLAQDSQRTTRSMKQLVPTMILSRSFEIQTNLRNFQLANQ